MVDGGADAYELVGRTVGTLALARRSAVEVRARALDALGLAPFAAGSGLRAGDVVVLLGADARATAEEMAQSMIEGVVAAPATCRADAAASAEGGGAAVVAAAQPGVSVSIAGMPPVELPWHDLARWRTSDDA